jgi:hypothetical protein
VTPTGPRKGDFALALLDAEGHVLARTNATPGDFQAEPALPITSAVTAMRYVQVTRSDDAPITKAYSFQLLEGVGIRPASPRY